MSTNRAAEMERARQKRQRKKARKIGPPETKGIFAKMKGLAGGAVQSVDDAVRSAANAITG